VTRRTTVADVVVDGLRRAGTPYLVGLAHGAADAHVLAAARAIGLPVVLASSGRGARVIAAVAGDLADAPGAAAIGDTPDALQDAFESGPSVLITSGHPSPIPGCKETLGVEPESAAHRIAHAARLAMTEPRGPVHLDIAAPVAQRAAVPLATSCRPDAVPYPAAEALDRAARELAQAARPLLLAGAHCRSSDAAQWLRAFAEALPAPLLTTARAKGALPDPHPLMLGVLGVTGTGERLLSRADLVVAVGLDTPEADTLPEPCWSTARVLALGPAAVPDGRRPLVQVLGAVSAIVEELAGRLRDKPRADWDVAEVDRLWRESAARDAGDGLETGVVRLAREATEAGTIATVDAGPYYGRVVASWRAVSPRELLVPSGPASAGFALPAAIAVHLAHPERRIVCFSGAAELAAANELETAARLGAPIATVVFDTDGADASPLVRQAERLSLSAFVVDGEPRFAAAFARALAAKGPSLIVVRRSGVAVEL